MTKKENSLYCSTPIKYIAILIIMSVFLFSACSNHSQEEEFAKRREELRRQEAQNAVEKQQETISKVMSKIYGIDIKTQSSMLDKLKRGYFYSAEIEEELTKKPLLIYGCIKDVIKKPYSQDYTVFMDSCHGFMSGNKLYYKLHAEEGIVNAILAEKVGHSEPFIAVVQVKNVEGMINGNDYEKTYQVNGEFLDISLFPQLKDSY